jgi:2-methylcitrate dehydratase PrpD
MSASSDHPSESAASQGISRSLARYVVATRFDDLPGAVRREAQRSLLNWMGVAVGDSRHETIEIALAAIKPFVGAPQATLFGRAERLDVMHAALINGISSHVFDFDDTDLTVQPSAPVLPVLLALAEQRGIRGRDFVGLVQPDMSGGDSVSHWVSRLSAS